MWVNNIMIYASCSRLGFIHWLQGHLIPCPFKYLTGIDCPGCGFQRSVVALIQGDFQKSFFLYPAAIPLILFFIYGIADVIFKLDTDKAVVKKTIFMINGSIVLISYVIKMWHLYNHVAY
ncbi:MULTISPECIES: DUF2752 domain-containing protein [Mucilaginibacter]|uniref:DUF2752 domain-containing protein n=1 Tax=Mucilaginibacter TaxID=423349 RepID=UPI00087138A4|nr:MULTISPECIES: DUF2752 domain-containing protein [Mucilaginibacter]GGB28296.1 hypothetical protein GCM10011500_50730 [Mucilaginibacter rubeus]SCW88114.1 Protein of unknown function [Mucilaginibacter sp. NFR10]